MRLAAIFRRIVKQMVYDKRTLGLILIAPVFIISIISIVMNQSSYKPTIADCGLPTEYAQILKDQDATIKTMTPEQAKTALTNGDLDGYVTYNEDTGIKLYVLGSVPNQDAAANRVMQSTYKSIAQKLKTDSQTKLDQFLSSAQPALKEMLKGNLPKSPPELSVVYQTGKTAELSTFDAYGSVFLGVISFFFVFLLAGISFMRERNLGTFDRLFSTPVRRWEVVMGYLMGFGIFAVIQALIITGTAFWLLKMYSIGSAWLVILFMVSLSACALSFGALMSVFATSEFQIMQFIPVVILPQIFFTGIVPLETMHPVLRAIAYICPLYYGVTGLKEVMVHGAAFSGIWVQLVVLWGQTALFGILNAQVLRKYRAI